jgi:hypothetical protein
MLQAVFSAELIPLVLVIFLKLLSKIMLATKESYLERGMRVDQMKTAKSNHAKGLLLEAKRTKREAAEEAAAAGGPLPKRGFSRMARPKTAPINIEKNVKGTRTRISKDGESMPHEPNILTLDGSRDHENGGADDKFEDDDANGRHVHRTSSVP